MTAFLHLNLRGWRQMRRAWSLPATAGIEMQTYVYGTARSLASHVQSAVVRARHPLSLSEGCVVILGFWRSGTTLLHELLCTDDRFSYPTTYACLNPHHFVLSQNLMLARTAHIQVRRAQDKMMIGFRSPQEDEFALLCLGARSPYEGLVAPQYFAQAMALADPKDLTDAEAQYWRTAFDAFLRGVSLVSGRKRLILKSPTHSYRVSTLRELLPACRFVLIVRNPYEVFESMVRAYGALTEKFGLGTRLSNDELRLLILRERTRFEAKLRSGIAGLPQNRFAMVRYENLTDHPQYEIEKLYRQLELGDFDQMRGALSDEIAKRRGYVQDAVMPDPSWRQRITEEWSEIFEEYGYQKDVS